MVRIVCGEQASLPRRALDDSVPSRLPITHHLLVPSMPQLRAAEAALRLASRSSQQPYICTACRRQFHTSRLLLAAENIPFWKRIQTSLFGSKESNEAVKRREEKSRERINELAKRDDYTSALEVRTDKRGREYEVAALIDPTINSDYAPATKWDGLESIGSEKWVKARRDTGEKYDGYVEIVRCFGVSTVLIAAQILPKGPIDTIE